MDEERASLANILASQHGDLSQPYWGETQWMGGFLPMPQKGSPAAHSILDLIKYLSLGAGRAGHGRLPALAEPVSSPVRFPTTTRPDRPPVDYNAMGIDPARASSYRAKDQASLEYFGLAREFADKTPGLSWSAATALARLRRPDLYRAYMDADARVSPNFAKATERSSGLIKGEYEVVPPRPLLPPPHD